MSNHSVVENDSDSETLHDPLSRQISPSRNDEEKNNDCDLPLPLKKEEPNTEADGYTGFRVTQDPNKPPKRRLQFEQIKATGPGKGFNPTNARFRVRWNIDDDSSNPDRETGEKPARKLDNDDEVALRWSSRYNRKGRNSFVVSRRPSADQRQASHRFRRARSSLKRVGKNIVRMFFSFPYWDMAFWSGWSYSWGSVLFVIDAGFAWVPLAFPYTAFRGESYAVGLLFFFGAMLYQVGASVAYLEAINDGSFHGSAMKRFLEGHEDDQKRLLDEKLQAFFGHLVPSTGRRSRKQRRIGRLANAVDVEAGWNPTEELAKAGSFRDQRRGGIDYGAPEEGETTEYLPWRWWVTWHSLKTHYVREIGWWACSIQLFGATLYGMCAVIAIPPIIDSLSHWQENAAYWIPQMVASVCFLVASILFTLETQEKWYKPELAVLGWWVGFWAGVGSTGFLLCACLGPAYGNTGAVYQSSLASLWGSAAYLISALLQWYEAVNKNPIEELFNEPGHLKSFQVHL